MIWAVTQHYADFDAQIQALSGKRALSKKAFDAATEEVVALIIRACGAKSPNAPTQAEAHAARDERS
ncbi:MAG TPA: TetR family transcriptional regulator C-terminal domain-containing protein, partial [Trinickia sp.]|nr:TetR family transcriptional regulator C-terminal domain-containing protein [Trinickia sp.]